MTPFRPPYSIATLEAFLAVARLGSFTRAAECLCLTQGAVSKHIRLLESHLGVPLFSRVGGVALTPAGRMFLEGVEPALDQLAATDRRVRQTDPDVTQIRILAPPAVLQYWLIPLLPGIGKDHPDIDLQVSTRLLSARVAEQDVDAEIRFGTGSWQGVSADYLFGREMAVIASPEHLSRDPVTRPEDLARWPLLQHVLYPTAWAEWNATLAPGMRLPAPRQSYDHYAVMIEAIRAGLGIGLMPRLLVRQHLSDGLLVAPFNEVMLGSCGYFLVLDETRIPPRRLSTVRNWFVAQAREMAQAWLAHASPPVHYRSSDSSASAASST
ncbi:LysR substrate-binding domain-containing protein [Cupriavidus sp. AU9028]|uniref:LysR substrate-binding domain-containing protein n=1 Tax=Cupriavidus sp. AU9028 TaxID=2871157 RepID=UPI001C93FDBB|nr:LysR substrate-binding domain-containing protein [Cupriavidus sp. AU9028]MBY4896504.1 LysR family transcriptional regulator [Cupriavidus sp. AU9028]